MMAVNKVRGVDFSDLDLIKAFVNDNVVTHDPDAKSYSVIFSNGDVKYVRASNMNVARVMANEYGMRMLSGARVQFLTVDHR